MHATTTKRFRWLTRVAVTAALIMTAASRLSAQAQETRGKTSYDQIAPALLGQETFSAVMAKDKTDKAEVLSRQKKLLEDRYDLASRTHPSLKMTRGKPVSV